MFMRLLRPWYLVLALLFCSPALGSSIWEGDKPDLGRPEGYGPGVYLIQMGGGLLGGVSLGFLGALLAASTVSCSDDPEADNFGCGMAAAAKITFAGSAGYMLGTSLGIYYAGAVQERQGSYLASLAGSLVGFAAGVYLSSWTGLEAGGAIILTLSLTNMASLVLYSMTDRSMSDRVEAGFSLEPAPMGSKGLARDRSPPSLRAQARVILWRL